MPDKNENEIELKQKTTIRERRAEVLFNKHRIVLFKGDILYLAEDGIYHHLTSDQFARMVYQLGSMPYTTVRDLEKYVRGTAPDRTDLAQYIAFGDYVWDMDKVDFTDKISPEDCIYCSRVQPSDAAVDKVNQYLLEVANNNPEVRKDILQSIAPLFTTIKPAGVIWWQGSGSNSKSATMHLITALLKPYLASVTLKQLEDERDTPVLNGKLGNIVGESSEGVIEDSRTYKAIGTHDDFSVHKFNSQDQITISGNLHHIFSTNNMPIFGDKSNGARRRTLIIKFQNRFKDDPMFEAKTFTPEFIAAFLHLCLEEAKQLKKQNYQYRFSNITQQVKAEYDDVVNTAETFAQYLIDMGVQYFSNFSRLRMAYEWWCDSNSYSALGKTHLRNAILAANFKRSSMRNADDKIVQIFLHEGGTTENTKELFLGVYVAADADVKVKLDTEAEEKAKQTVLDKGW